MINMSIYVKKLEIDNSFNEIIGFSEDTDLNNIAYIKYDDNTLPSGRVSSKNNYCCVFCNKECEAKIGNRCTCLEKSIMCPNAEEVHIKGFRKNSKNEKLLQETMNKMKYLLVFGDLSDWAYENKAIGAGPENHLFSASDIDIFDAHINTKFENITDSEKSKAQILSEIEQTRKYDKWQYSAKNTYNIDILRVIYYSYINYFRQYADLCSSAAFMPDNQKDLYKLQLSTVGLNFENIDKYVHKVHDYYLFDNTFNIYIPQNGQLKQINEHVCALKLKDSLYATMCIKLNEILEAAESINKDKNAITRCFYRDTNAELFIKVVDYLAGVKE